VSKKSEKVLVEDWVPPPLGSKKEVLKFRSVKSIVIAPASTGNDINSKIVVINTDQTNKGIRSHVIG